MPLDPELRSFATGDNFAALTTLFPDGQPQTQVMWIDADDDHLLINTEDHRAKYRNMRQDPRVTVAIWEAGNPYRYLEVRGRVVDEVRGDEAMAQLDACSYRYRGTAYDRSRITGERVVMKITPERMHRRGF
jgi:PPOX class probable F420-dependent enzyme